MNIPSTDDVLSKYKEIYPSVEELVSAQNLFYEKGLNDLDRLYKEWNIPGTEKVKYIAQYVMTATTAIITNSQQMAMTLLNSAYSLPSELTLKEAQIDNLTKDIAVKDAQMSKIQSDIAYVKSQAKVLEESSVLNALIKAFQSVCDMMGSMGSGGIVAPTSMIAVSRDAIFKTMELLTKSDGTKVFTSEEIKEWTTLKANDDSMKDAAYNINKS